MWWMLHVEDVLILSGLAVVVGATFSWSRLAGWYATGTVLFGLGIWFARHPPGSRGR
jgi:hypothetical protein